MVDVKIEEKPGGQYGRDWCSAPHPTAAGVWCRRKPGHEDRGVRHGAFVFKISVIEEWDVYLYGDTTEEWA